MQGQARAKKEGKKKEMKIDAGDAGRLIQLDAVSRKQVYRRWDKMAVAAAITVSCDTRTFTRRTVSPL